MQNVLTVNSNKRWDRIMIMRKFFENNLYLTFFFSKIEGQGGVGTEMGGRGGEHDPPYSSLVVYHISYQMFWMKEVGFSVFYEKSVRIVCVQ